MTALASRAATPAHRYVIDFLPDTGRRLYNARTLARSLSRVSASLGDAYPFIVELTVPYRRLECGHFVHRSLAVGVGAHALSNLYPRSQPNLLTRLRVMLAIYEEALAERNPAEDAL